MKKLKKSVAREIKYLKSCENRENSQYVVNIINSYIYKEKVWIVMEYCNGGTLRTFSRANLSEEQVAYVMHSVLKGLGVLHNLDIAHRDIKDDNILMNMNGDIKIADLGLAIRVVGPRSIRTPAGTRRWMAPEILRDEGYGIKADIWSCGCLCYQMMEGDIPYSKYHGLKAIFYTATVGKDKHPLNEKWSKTIRGFLNKFLKFDPDFRSTTDELIEHKFIRKNMKDVNMDAILEILKYSFLIRATENLDL